MKKTKHRTKMKLGKSERGLKIVAAVSYTHLTLPTN